MAGLEEFYRIPWLQYPEKGLPREQQIQFLIDQCMPGTIGMKILAVSETEMTASIPFMPKTANAAGLMHGGTIFTLGDTVTGCLLWYNHPQNRYVTAGSNIRFLRPITKGQLFCTAKVIEKNGPRYRLRADYKDEDGQRIAQMKIDYVAVEHRDERFTE